MLKTQYDHRKRQIIQNYGQPEWDMGDPVNDSAKLLFELKKQYLADRRLLDGMVPKPSYKHKICITKKKWSEKEAIKDLKKDGYEVFNTGWPDLMLIKDKEVLFVELKGPGDKLRSSQKKLLGVLAELGLNVEVRYYVEE